MKPPISRNQNLPERHGKRTFSGQIVSQLNAVLFESMCCKAGKHLQAGFGLTRQKRNV